MPWTLDDAADQTGKVVVITGANSGVGLASARALAEKGATVVMGCRDSRRGEAAAEQVRAAAPRGTLHVLGLDLASLNRVAAFARDVAERFPRVDVLMNNAGVMALPYGKTVDGFEQQLGTNHLGHFALTAQLLPLLEAAPEGRVVTVASQAHRVGRLDLDDLPLERGYGAWRAYARSKLANLLFSFELERWLRRNGKRSLAVAAHPGYSATGLLKTAPRTSVFGGVVLPIGSVLLAQSSEMGALPQVYAAVSPEVAGGEYIGPDGLLELSGFPRVVRASGAAYDEAVAARLWQVSEALTKVSFS